MNKELITNLLQQKTYQVPSALLNLVTKQKLNSNALIALIYLLNQPQPVMYDPNKLADSLSFEKNNVLSAIHDLEEAGLLTFKLINNNHKKQQEYLQLDPLFDLLAAEFLKTASKSNQKNLYDVFAQEFGRALSPIEIEIINSWIDQKMDVELIKGALKEAIFNGVTNLRYIDKILYEWNKAGIKNPKDIKAKKTPAIKKEELFDYNWLEE